MVIPKIGKTATFMPKPVKGGQRFWNYTVINLYGKVTLQFLWVKSMQDYQKKLYTILVEF